ncbi:MAG: formate--tetrahydrofolate ligase [Planctomycetes bacterium]|nr:formate--tetrahydrofolate ligase [Planctomycetota bacterium]
MTTSDAPLPIAKIAERLGLSNHDIEPYGHYAAKLSFDIQSRSKPLGKYIGITAINPTPFGEGKTVVSIGLAMGLCRRGKNGAVTLRQPSLAPIFGIKGGGAGGGRSRVIPSEDINLHFTGDLHAVAAANNLLAAMLDNHCARQLSPIVESADITWRRAIDISDKGLAYIRTGLNHVPMAPERDTGFDLTAASEVMSILSLAADLHDLRHRLGKIIVTSPHANQMVSADDIGAAGAMAVLLRKALQPNLVQTIENTPAFVHAGPFGNISHGNSSIIADKMALRLADYVVTESGFGSDLGAEKLFNMKCRQAGIAPAAEVLVCTVRALKYHSGRFEVRPGRPLPDGLLREDLEALKLGAANLIGHLENLRQYGIPIVVAINQFPSDCESELQLIERIAKEAGATRVARVTCFSRGGDGAVELADAVIDASAEPSHFQPLYPLDIPYAEKLATVAKRVYGAADIALSSAAQQLLESFGQRGFEGLPVIIAKTQYSLSHDPKLLGRPTGFTLPIQDVRLAAGAGFVLAMTEGITLMPGLPKIPAAKQMDLLPDGTIKGLKME